MQVQGATGQWASWRWCCPPRARPGDSSVVLTHQEGEAAESWPQSRVAVEGTEPGGDPALPPLCHQVASFTSSFLVF